MSNKLESSFFWYVTRRRLVLVTVVSGQPPSRANHLTLEGETGRLSRNYQYTLRNVPEQRWHHLHRVGSLESSIKLILVPSHNRSTGRQITWLYSNLPSSRNMVIKKRSLLFWTPYATDDDQEKCDTKPVFQHLNPVGSWHIFFYHLIPYFLLPVSSSIHAGSYCPTVLHLKPIRNSQDTLLLGLKKYVNTAMQAHDMSGNSPGLWPSYSAEKTVA